MRWFRLLLGATAPAVSATLVAFFAGQMLGAVIGGRRAAASRSPLATYGRFEVAAAGRRTRRALPPLRAARRGGTERRTRCARRPSPSKPCASPSPSRRRHPPAVCFGATLPPLAAAVVRDGRPLGPRGALLVGANTLGAAAGTALASFVLPYALGVRAGYAVGLAALLVAGTTAWWIGRSDDLPPVPEEDAPAEPDADAMPRTCAPAPGRPLGRRRLRGTESPRPGLRPGPQPVEPGLRRGARRRPARSGARRLRRVLPGASPRPPRPARLGGDCVDPRLGPLPVRLLRRHRRPALLGQHGVPGRTTCSPPWGWPWRPRARRSSPRGSSSRPCSMRWEAAPTHPWDGGWAPSWRGTREARCSARCSRPISCFPRSGSGRASRPLPSSTAWRR